MAAHVKVTIIVEDPNDHDHGYRADILIRGDLLSMDNDRRRDAALQITMQRVSETFVKVYHAACQPPAPPDLGAKT